MYTCQYFHGILDSGLISQSTYCYLYFRVLQQPLQVSDSLGMAVTTVRETQEVWLVHITELKPLPSSFVIFFAGFF